MKSLMAMMAMAFLLALTASAEDFRIEVDPKVYPKSKFAQKGVKVSAIPTRHKRPDTLPDKKERDAMLSRVPGLEGDLEKMDELGRDLLFVHAGTKPLKELKNVYPGIDEKKLTLLQKELKK